MTQPNTKFPFSFTPPSNSQPPFSFNSQISQNQPHASPSALFTSQSQNSQPQDIAQPSSFLKPSLTPNRGTLNTSSNSNQQQQTSKEALAEKLRLAKEKAQNSTMKFQKPNQSLTPRDGSRSHKPIHNSQPSSSSKIKKRIPVPFPLPTKRNQIHLPPHLKEKLLSSLTTNPGSLTRISEAFSTSLEEKGWNRRVKDFALERIRDGEDGEVERVERVERVVLGYFRDGRDADKEGERGQDGVDGLMGLNIPNEVIERGVEVVKNELRGVVGFVDAVDWDG